MIPRTIARHVATVLDQYNKMAFISGPRQVGKTTLAKMEEARFPHTRSFNWDIVTDQKLLLNNPYFFESEDRDPGRPFLVVFDEIHKYARWKNYLKGAYDRFHEEFRFLVTGSGRLDLFKKGGDSLLGRYVSVPLFPFTVGELSGRLPSWSEFRKTLNDPPAAGPAAKDAYRTLFRFSGFPEPFVKGDTTFYNTWFQDRKSLLVREDIRGGANIRELSLLEMLSHLIPDRVGAPLSVNSLREDIGVAFETVRDWLLLLEQFYYLARITPFTGSLRRTLKKEAKAYLYDWVEVSDEGFRFENLVALHLLKAVKTWRAMGAGDLGLHYVRDKEKREVDFVLTENNRPACLIECKTADRELSPALAYFQDKLKVPVAVQLAHASGVCRKTSRSGRIQWVISADRWLDSLP
jgi:hypothetical protein